MGTEKSSDANLEGKAKTPKVSGKDVPTVTEIRVLDDGSGHSYEISGEELARYARTGDDSEIRSNLPPGARLILPCGYRRPPRRPE